MLALPAVQGEFCLRTDLSKTFRLTGTNPAILAHWTLTGLPGGTSIYTDAVTGQKVVARDGEEAGLFATETGPVGPTGAAGPNTITGATTTTLTGPLKGNGSIVSASVITKSEIDNAGTWEIGEIPTGTTASTVCIGNDARLSDARTPLTHVHAAGDVTSGQFAMARLASGAPDGTKFVRDDGTLVTPPTGSANAGNATIDFGAFPGKSDTSVAVTGQTGIVAGSVLNAWIRPTGSADHSADEHLVETLKVLAGNIVAGTGFTIYGINAGQFNEPVEEGTRGGRGGRGTRLYGTFNVSWSWS